MGAFVDAGWGVWDVPEQDLVSDVEALVKHEAVSDQTVLRILGDLTLEFDNEDLVDWQPLIRSGHGSILVVPLYIVDRPLPDLYIHLSKALYLDAYSRAQQRMSKDFERIVAEVLAEKSGGRRPQAVNLADKGQIDLVLADSGTNSLLLVEIKHLTSFSNRRIEEGLAQLTRDEDLCRDRWPEISARLPGLSVAPPTCVRKVLVTNWFRGVIQTPGDVLVVSHSELAGLPGADSLDGLLVHLDRFERELPPDALEYDECQITLCGYRFEYESSRLRDLGVLLDPEPEAPTRRQ